MIPAGTKCTVIFTLRDKEKVCGRDAVVHVKDSDDYLCSSCQYYVSEEQLDGESYYETGLNKCN